MTDITITSDEKPLRKDAERNRRRILDAARQLFAERGLGVTLNDIAHHAGVGVGTVYRRFPDKARLIDELFEESVEDLVELMQAASADPDAWRGLVGFLTQVTERQACDRALKDLLTSTPDGAERVCRIRDRLLPMGAELVRRAQEAGRLRPDVAAQDVPIIQLMVGTIIDAADEVDPELWRRYLALIIRGLAARPDEEPPLAPPPLAPEVIDQVMARGKGLRR